MDNCMNCRHFCEYVCGCEDSPYSFTKTDIAPSKYNWCEWFEDKNAKAADEIYAVITGDRCGKLKMES